MKTLRLNPNLHIEFDLPLRAALIFPLSHTVQSAASDTPMKMSLFNFICEIYNWQARARLGIGREEEEECMGGIQGMGRVARWGCGKGVSEYARLICSMLARTTTTGRMATVWVFCCFFLLSGNQSVQRFWAPGEPTRHVARCSLSWGRDGESSDFSGHHEAWERKKKLSQQSERGWRGWWWGIIQVRHTWS